ncbi:Uncharacterized protein OBRU01_16248, partial [Operophtera brumata]
RKSGQFSDVGEDRSRSQHDLSKQQRSASLIRHHITGKYETEIKQQTLEAGGVVNLDTLEAKMASIEVSLGGSRRRSAGARDGTRELDALRTALSDKDSLIQSLKKQLSASLSAARLVQGTSPPPSRTESQECATLSADERRALEERAQAVKADLEASKSNILELRKRLEKTHQHRYSDTAGRAPVQAGARGGTSPPPSRTESQECTTLSADERRALEERAQAVKADLEASKSNILELRKRLEKTHVTDNIDTRIQQAELQYKLGREDMVRDCGGSGILLPAEVREGTWAAAPRAGCMAVEWSNEPALRVGDR